MKVKDIYYSDAVTFGNDYLAHHGIKGQRWGVRRYQNKDGTLTNAGKKRRTLSQIRSDNAEKIIAKIQAKKHVNRKNAVKIYNKHRAASITASLLASGALSAYAVGSAIKNHEDTKKRLLKEIRNQTR